MHLPGPGFTPGTGELDIFIHSSAAVGMICFDIFPIASCVSGMCYADPCLLGAMLRQRVSRWFMNRLLSAATSGLLWLGLESACTLLLFLFLDLQSWLTNQMLQKCGAEEVLASKLFCKSLAWSKGWIWVAKGALGKDGWWTWSVVMS